MGHNTLSKLNTKNKRGRKWQLYLFNDKRNSMEHVVDSLNMHIPMCNRYRAEQLAIIAEHHGHVVIYEGGNMETLILYNTLIQEGLTVDATLA